MKNKIYFLALTVLCLLLCPPRPAAAAGMVTIDVGDAHESITLAVPGASPHKVFLLEHPDRLVVDVPAISGHPHATLPPSYDGALIKSLRHGWFNPHTLRFVFDLERPIRVDNVQVKDNNTRLVIRISARNAMAAPEKKAPRKTQKPLVIIDPGHGGIDPGTIGPNGTKEKNITLMYAKALARRLLKTGRYRVKLTRGDDHYLTLRDRVALARKAEGAIFISLHADSAPEMAARGLSVYTVSEKASDAETAELAARENKSDVLAGVNLSDEGDDVAGILISLAARETKNDSARLADTLVHALGKKVHLLVNTHRFAGFAVLKAPDIPSVLIEIGFLSNPKEEKLLKSQEYRDEVTAGILAGVEAYFSREKQAGGM
ncbi:MAG: N-acetylmuramoyl-L-alanine amidase [Pseudomonadota bacterium]|nr:N-acetylmuramoyl-L-alanine amidase [Pseudomonadota bacterium]